MGEVDFSPQANIPGSADCEAGSYAPMRNHWGTIAKGMTFSVRLAPPLHGGAFLLRGGSYPRPSPMVYQPFFRAHPAQIDWEVHHSEVWNIKVQSTTT